MQTSTQTQRIRKGTRLALHDIQAVRQHESRLAQELPSHALMRAASAAAANLARAIAPHAQTLWVACGPGNNGGDGLWMAAHLQRQGLSPIVSWLGKPGSIPPDARQALEQARQAGVRFMSESAPPPALSANDLCVDALLGIGANRAPGGRMADLLQVMRSSPAQLLSLDIPSGLQADTGQYLHGDSNAAAEAGTGQIRHTLSFLCAKPGLFTGDGQGLAGQVWLAPLIDTAAMQEDPVARLNTSVDLPPRGASSHKGRFGDVLVVGGACSDSGSMAGAALLAASAALHGGAGRVYIDLLGQTPAAASASLFNPALMVRTASTLPLGRLAVVAGCGGGKLIGGALPVLLQEAASLVLDADALNAIAADSSLQTLLRRRHPHPTVLSPHPLEAARLLGCTTAEIQADRLRAAQELGARFACTVVLKGSGTVIVAPGQAPCINPSGNARLATAGTGDVLAGLLGAYIAAAPVADVAVAEAVCAAVYQHGLCADQWPAGRALTADQLATSMLSLQAQ